MKKLLYACMAFLSGTISADAYSAPGEYWEVTTKMEMPGMPFAMPATTTKVCIPKGGEKDPRHSAKDKDCEMTDIKFTGNKTSWKVRCNHNGEIMNGSGENTSNADGYEGKMHLAGKSGGQDINMTQTYHGKRIGGNCDSEELSKKMQAQAKDMSDKMCDTSKSDTREWISRASLLLDNKTCPGKKEPLCDAVRKDAPRDADVYQHLVTTEKNNGNLVTKACGLNMDATTKAQCKNINGKNYRTLSAYCPAEAKVYREAARKKECEGRSYTAHENLSKCLNGQSGSGDEGAAEEAQSKSEPNKSKSGTNNPAESIIDGAKKLKGLFGF